jgi:mRNA-degrading endonuclease toxin of MazEF toxin-antitoxin module
VPLPSSGKISGVVLVDQVKTLDWRSRRAVRIESVDAQVVEDVVELVKGILME